MSLTMVLYHTNFSISNLPVQISTFPRTDDSSSGTEADTNSVGAGRLIYFRPVGPPDDERRSILRNSDIFYNLLKTFNRLRMWSEVDKLLALGW
jgi:hypothetical protein